MQMGLLWFDNDPRKILTTKIEDAARRYREKFGAPPDTCYVNQAALAGGQGVVGAPGLRLVPAANILPHHFWIGVEEHAG